MISWWHVASTTMLRSVKSLKRFFHLPFIMLVPSALWKVDFFFQLPKVCVDLSPRHVVSSREVEPTFGSVEATVFLVQCFKHANGVKAESVFGFKRCCDAAACAHIDTSIEIALLIQKILGLAIWFMCPGATWLPLFWESALQGQVMASQHKLCSRLYWKEICR